MNTYLLRRLCLRGTCPSRRTLNMEEKVCSDQKDCVQENSLSLGSTAMEQMEENPHPGPWLLLSQAPARGSRVLMRTSPSTYLSHYRSLKRRHQRANREQGCQRLLH